MTAAGTGPRSDAAGVGCRLLGLGQLLVDDGEAGIPEAARVGEPEGKAAAVVGLDLEPHTGRRVVQEQVAVAVAEKEAAGLRPMPASEAEWIIAQLARMHGKDVLSEYHIENVKKMAAVAHAKPVSRVLFGPMLGKAQIERSMTIPGTSYRIGLDTLVGLVPVAGDLITAAMGSYIVWEARNLGLPKWKLWQMVGRLGSTFSWPSTMSFAPPAHSNSGDHQ